MSFSLEILKRNLFEGIKKNIPVEINKLLLELNQWPELIFGKEYAKHYALLKENNQVNKKAEEQLLLMTEYCLKKVPYYQKRYGNYSIGSIDDFKKIIEPIDKQEVLDNLDEFVAKGIKKVNYDFATTGGTSGKPLNLYLPKERYAVEMATLHYVWGRLGYDFSKRGVIRNTKLKANQDYIVNPVSKEFIFDGFRLNDDYFERVYRILKDNKIKYLHGYTSNIYLFGKFLISTRKDYSFLKGLFTSSENITPLMNRFFNEELKIQHINFYGHTEKLVFAAYCKDSDFYHVDSYYGFVEVLDEFNNDSLFGEITGTTLHNFGMPLLRYKTGDYAEVYNGVCHCCNFNGMILKDVHGRWDGSKIYNKDGSYITTTALNLHSDIYSCIEGLQYYQKSKGQLEVRIIKGKAYDEHTETELKTEILSKFNPDFKLEIVDVKNLEKKSNGKFLLLISDVV